MEEYAYILDYLPQGLNFKNRDPICYAIGDTEFKLFELVPKAGAMITIDDRVYIGKDTNLRKEIDHVKSRICRLLLALRPEELQGVQGRIWRIE